MNNKRIVKNCYGNNIDALNSSDSENVVYVDLETNSLKVETEENVNSLVRDGKALILPEKDILYNYEEVIHEYLSEHNLTIPEGEKPKQYLSDMGLVIDFNLFRDIKIEEMFAEWCQKHNIDFS